LVFITQKVFIVVRYIRYQSYEIAKVEGRETPQISQASDIYT